VPSNLECLRQKVVGEPDEGKPHVRFDVAGDENQDMAMVLRHSRKKWGANRLPSPTSQASSPDPTSRLATARFINYTLSAKMVLIGVCRAGPQAADAEALSG